MEHFKFNEWDLVGFLDSDEEISDEDLAQIEREYNYMVDNATEDEIEDFNANYGEGCYYPPFVAEAIDIVFGNN